MNVMILHSVDGADWARAILYPSDWTSNQADNAALDAFRAAQLKNLEWSWDDYEPELLARGFVIPNWHHGPVWDQDI